MNIFFPNGRNYEILPYLTNSEEGRSRNKKKVNKIGPVNRQVFVLTSQTS